MRSRRGLTPSSTRRRPRHRQRPLLALPELRLELGEAGSRLVAFGKRHLFGDPLGLLLSSLGLLLSSLGLLLSSLGLLLSSLGLLLSSLRFFRGRKKRAVRRLCR